ncbi:MAG: VacJ family lipoprotein [Gammaproteobacteria bacterium]
MSRVKVIRKLIKPILGTLSLSLCMGGLSSCANPKNPRSEDPLECLNRGVYHLNKGLDKVLVKPVAVVYDSLLPRPIKTGVHNIFQNLNDVPTAANSFLQFKMHQFGVTSSRFLVNSTLGVLGFFDVASRLGLQKYNEDCGTTLAFYGYKNSAYLILPVFGPSTIRDAIGGVGTHYMSVLTYKPDSKDLRKGLTLLKAVDARVEILKTEEAARASAVDEYVFIRDAYLQNRNAKINNTAVKKTEDLSQEGPPE